MGGSANRRQPEVVAHALEITKLCIERERDKSFHFQPNSRLLSKFQSGSLLI